MTIDGLKTTGDPGSMLAGEQQQSLRNDLVDGHSPSTEPNSSIEVDKGVPTNGKAPDQGIDPNVKPPGMAIVSQITPSGPPVANAVELLRTREDFRFKVDTVRWFGILCAAVIIGMIGLGFIYLDKIVNVAKAYESQMDFSKVLSSSTPDNTTVVLGLEHDGLSMRNKRAISALYMRAYTQFLAIIAGTIIALLGAVFVLARVDSVSTTNDASWGSFRWALSSSSPGVIIALLGATLIGGVVYLSSDAIQVNDAPVFLNHGVPDLSTASSSMLESPDFQKHMEERLKDLR